MPVLKNNGTNEKIDDRYMMMALISGRMLVRFIFMNTASHLKRFSVAPK